MNFEDSKDVYISLLQDEVQRLNEALRAERNTYKRKEAELEKVLGGDSESFKILKAQISSLEKKLKTTYGEGQEALQALELKYKHLFFKELQNSLLNEKKIFDKSATDKKIANAKLIIDSGLFDPIWYEKVYASTLNGQNPLLHYLENESTCDFNPSLLFDVKQYLEKYPDVKHEKSGILLHYLTFGKHEKRNIFQVVSESVQ